MTRSLTRRRFLTVTAAAIALPNAARAKPAVARWRGVALGASASRTWAKKMGSAMPSRWICAFGPPWSAIHIWQ